VWSHLGVCSLNDKSKFARGRSSVFVAPNDSPGHISWVDFFLYIFINKNHLKNKIHLKTCQTQRTWVYQLAKFKVIWVWQICHTQITWIWQSAKSKWHESSKPTIPKALELNSQPYPRWHGSHQHVRPKELELSG